MRERAPVTRHAIWTKLYIGGLSPDDAAAPAVREYDSTHRPEWVAAIKRLFSGAKVYAG